MSLIFIFLDNTLNKTNVLLQKIIFCSASVKICVRVFVCFFFSYGWYIFLYESEFILFSFRNIWEALEPPVFRLPTEMFTVLEFIRW